MKAYTKISILSIIAITFVICSKPFVTGSSKNDVSNKNGKSFPKHIIVKKLNVECRFKHVKPCQE
jgi:hypothetical protein